MRSRLKAAPHRALIDHVSAPGLARDSLLLWPYMMQAHLAHALMLRESGIIPTAVADRLLVGLLDLRAAGPSVLDNDPGIEDMYFNVEKYLQDSLGADVAGWLQTGRSRNDHYACVARQWVRAEAIAVAAELCALRERIIHLAERHVDTVITGYTHQQPAQPITFAHYLLAIEVGLTRDLARIQSAWPRVNGSPLGAGSMAGVSWPIDREFLARLLSFDAPLTNSIDAVASRDFAQEVVSGFVLTTLTISRLAADLQQFATWEFGGFEVGDDVAAVSSVMPQKKNPVSLEHCKGACAQVIGAWTAMVVSVKSAPYSHQRETSVESMKAFAEAVLQTKKALALMDATLQSLSVRQDVLARNAAQNFCTATDLADLLVREGGLTFREAHGVVGTAVRQVLEAGDGPAGIDAAVLGAVSKELTGKRVALSDVRVREVLDPRGSVEARSVSGGPATTAVHEQIELAWKQLDEERDWWTRRTAEIASVDERLEGLAQVRRNYGRQR